MAPAGNFALAEALLAEHGVVRIYAARCADAMLAGAGVAPAQRGHPLGLHVYRLPAHGRAAAVEAVSAALGFGGLSELPARRFGLDDIVAAHEAVERGVTGKVLIELA